MCGLKFCELSVATLCTEFSRIQVLSAEKGIDVAKTSPSKCETNR